MKILGTGLSGLVGSRIVELLKNRYELEASEVDITDRDRIVEKIRNSSASIVLHLAAKTDVDGCERDRSAAWAVNVNGTKNVAEACLETDKKLIYISTDFVFDGEKTSEYIEEDTPNPINWYAKTKYEGEKIVQTLSCPWIIARIAYPYRANFERNDFARAILKRLQDQKAVAGVTDHKFSPTFVDDITNALDALIKSESTGIFHVVGSQSLSPYDAAVKIAKTFDLDKSLISKTTREEYFKNRAKRPFQLRLRNDKIQRLGVKMRGFEEGLQEVKRQMVNF